MAITYVNKKYGGTDLRFPVLHTVVYATTADGVIASYQRSLKDCKVDAWLEENCNNRYYHSPGYERIKYIQFEDDVEAAMFALKFA